ncbi:MAG: transcriptional regulator [Coriobacteriia bacterium]|nr:transcriptional regulator [Coriobacteriia bacterium]
MKFYRIGDKVVSRDKLVDAIDAILSAREGGATQEDVARTHLVQRSFVSFLETLGEVRRGARVAVVGFPVSNAVEVKAVAEKHAVDFVLVLSQEEREQVESSGEATKVFNALLETIALLRDYDVVVLMASDWRINTMERILGGEVIGIPLGPSPLRSAVTVDLGELETVLANVMSARRTRRPKTRIGMAAQQVADLTGRWKPSKR